LGFVKQSKKNALWWVQFSGLKVNRNFALKSSENGFVKEIRTILGTLFSVATHIIKEGNQSPKKIEFFLYSEGSFPQKAAFFWQAHGSIPANAGILQYR
jgi:hypothetical protein